MKEFFGKFVQPGYALFRLVAGLLFACHGAQKLFGLLGGQAIHSPLMLVAGIIELAGGLAVASGFYADIAAFIASGQMAVAYFMAHAGKGFLPINNGGELAVLYCFVFLYIATRGSGSWSLDQLFRRQGRQRA